MVVVAAVDMDSLRCERCFVFFFSVYFAARKCFILREIFLKELV